MTQPNEERCTCGQYWGYPGKEQPERVPDPDCPVHHDEARGYHTEDGEGVGPSDQPEVDHPTDVVERLKVAAQAFYDDEAAEYPSDPELRDLLRAAAAKIERLLDENEFWRSAAHAHRLKGFDLGNENTNLRELLQDVLDETVASSTYPDGPNIDGDLRCQIREALEGD